MNFFSDDFFSASLVAFLTAAAIGVGLCRGVAFLPQAVPNSRSLHAKSMPRVAALMLWGGWLAGLGWLWVNAEVGQSARQGLFLHSWLFFLGWAAVAAVSLWDDCRGASACSRLGVQTAAALLSAVGWHALTSEINSGAFWMTAGVLVFSTVWMCNLFNFMDGSDGLAAVMALIGFAAYAWAGYVHGVIWWWLPALAVPALLPLLYVNWPPARMFIGDVGAVPLGFLAAGFSWWGLAEQAWGPWFPLLVFMPFILDATVTLLRRLLHREKVWEGHKTHYYQRLLQMGAGHRGTLAAYAAMMMGCAATALWCAIKAPTAGNTALFFWALIHMGFFAVIDYHWQKRRPS